MSLDGVNKAVGMANLAVDTATQTQPKTIGGALWSMKDVFMGGVSIFGGQAGSALAAQNDLANFCKSGMEKDKGGMAMSGFSYLTNMASVFSPPLGAVMTVNKLSYQLIEHTERQNPGSFEKFMKSGFNNDY